MRGAHHGSLPPWRSSSPASVLRLNAMLVVAVAGIAAGLNAGMSPVKLIETFELDCQFAFRDGLHRRYPLSVARMPRSHAAGRPLDVEDEVHDGRKTPCRLPCCASDQCSLVGLSSIGGPAQRCVLVVLMAEAAAPTHPPAIHSARCARNCVSSRVLSRHHRLFFGEDVHAIGSTCSSLDSLMPPTTKLEALQIALWAIPDGYFSLPHPCTPDSWLLDRKLADADVDIDEVPEPGHTVSLPPRQLRSRGSTND